MSTTLIHLTYDGNFKTECTTTIKEINTSSNNVTLKLNQTVMHPQGGGQPSDQGTITLLNSQEEPLLSIPINKVIIDKSNGSIIHEGTYEGDISEWTPGSMVKVCIDEERRRVLSECHTAGHVVDAAMSKCGQTFPPTKGYHFLDGPYVEYKGTLPVNQRPELLQSLKVAFQEIIDQDMITSIESLNKTIADEKCNRQANNFDFSTYKEDDEIRVVTVAGWSCPCGGTHVSSTGDLKERGWGISGIKCKKDVIRIKYTFKM